MYFWLIGSVVGVASAVSASAWAHSVQACFAEIFPFSFLMSLSGPAGLPKANRYVENGCITLMFASLFTRDKHTYAAICSVVDTLLDQCCRSTKAASSVAPCIMWAVELKSGNIQKPVRRASIPVCLFTFHVLERGFNG